MHVPVLKITIIISYIAIHIIHNFCHIKGSTGRNPKFPGPGNMQDIVHISCSWYGHFIFPAPGNFDISLAFSGAVAIGQNIRHIS